jgi:hypothetical protein
MLLLQWSQSALPNVNEMATLMFYLLKMVDLEDGKDRIKEEGNKIGVHALHCLSRENLAHINGPFFEAILSEKVD